MSVAPGADSATALRPSLLAQITAAAPLLFFAYSMWDALHRPLAGYNLRLVQHAETIMGLELYMLIGLSLARVTSSNLPAGLCLGVPLGGFVASFWVIHGEKWLAAIYFATMLARFLREGMQQAKLPPFREKDYVILATMYLGTMVLFLGTKFGPHFTQTTKAALLASGQVDQLAANNGAQNLAWGALLFVLLAGYEVYLLRRTD